MDTKEGVIGAKGQRKTRARCCARPLSARPGCSLSLCPTVRPRVASLSFRTKAVTAGELREKQRSMSVRPRPSSLDQCGLAAMSDAWDVQLF